ncbi:oligosaccharide flippase family protein [Methylomarinum vadi]|uniref:oligosaccharide flippase family protein n=1 Tax=Methylomarinum vadi TaxID=438855 RepID=UPI00068B3B10|nr:flippase [Methylomarinum vadi]
MFKAFFKDSAIYAIPSFVSRGLSFILIPLYTRVLTPADYGALDLLLVFASFVNITVALEVSQGLARYYRTQSNDNIRIAYASSGFWFTLVCYTTFSLVALNFSESLSEMVMGKEGLRREFQIGVLYIWANGIFYLIQNQFRWELRSKQYAIVSLFMTFCTAGMAVYLTYGMVWGLRGLLLGMVFGTLVGTVIGLWFLRHTFRFCFDLMRLKEMLIFSSPLVLSGIAVIVSSYIDRIMINHFLSVHEVGIYGIGFRLAAIVGLFIAGFQAAFVPLVYNNYKNPDTPNQMARIFRVFVALCLFAFLMLSVFAQDILIVLTTPEYYAASILVPFLVPGILLSQMYFFAAGIGIAKKSHYLIWINLIGAIINSLLNWLLIPYMGVLGAAVATLIGYLSVFSVYMIYSQKLYYVPYQWTRIVAIACSIAAFAWGFPFVELEPMTRILVSLLTVFLGGWLIVFSGCIKTSELQKFVFMLTGRLAFDNSKQK